MSDNQIHDQRRFAIDGIKNTGFYYTKSLVDGKYKLPILYCLQLIILTGLTNLGHGKGSVVVKCGSMKKDYSFR